MSNAIESLQAAQKHAMTIRPRVGGFPYLAEALRRAGVMKKHLVSSGLPEHLPDRQGTRGDAGPAAGFRRGGDPGIRFEVAPHKRVSDCFAQHFGQISLPSPPKLPPEAHAFFIAVEIEIAP
jgi:hypothetical protein